MPFDLTKKNDPFRYLAVVIGINDYKSPISPLETPTNDAQHFAEIIKDTYGYTIIKNLTGKVELAALQTLFETELPALNLEARDRLIIYFAGHGVARQRKQKQPGGEGQIEADLLKADVPSGFLVTSNAEVDDIEGTCLEMDWFYQQIRQLQCGHLMIILDCCFAGTIRWSVTTRGQPILPEELHRKQFERFTSNPSWVVLTSAAHDEEAIDLISSAKKIRGEIVGQTYSPFAETLFQALRNAEDNADYIRDGIITAGELELFLRHELINKTGSHLQTPGLWRLRPEDKGEFLFLLPSAQPDQLPEDPELSTDNNPYRGLKAFDFDETQSQLFFGRTQATLALADLIDKRRLTLVLGASGTGKSSLVKAGLMPLLNPFKKEKAEEERAWQVLQPMTPGANPLEALDYVLNAELDNPAKTTNAIAIQDKIRLLLQSGQKLLLVIDQFEELVTRSERRLRREFLDLLEALLKNREFENLRLVLTLRTDFEARFRDDRSAFGQRWKRAVTWREPDDGQQPQPVEAADIPLRFIVPPLNRDEFREAIVGPATRRVIYFETPQLVEEMIDEVLQMPGGLPRLSFTLEAIYRHYLDEDRKDRTFTRADYKAVGGIAGSLSKQANDLYGKLPSAEHKDTMRRIILRMIIIQDGNVTRRRVYEDEFEYGDQVEYKRATTVLDNLIEARLLVTDNSDSEQQAETKQQNGANPYYEPAHDALIDGWDKVADWRRLEQVNTRSSGQPISGDEVISLQRRVTDAANTWKTARDAGEQADLWDGSAYLPQIEQVLQGDWYQDLGRLRQMYERAWDRYFPRKEPPEKYSWLHHIWKAAVPQPLPIQKPYWLNKIELDFITESLHQRRWNRQKFFFSVVAFILVVLIGAGAATFFGVEANQQRILADENAATAIAERDIAISRQLAAQSNDAFDEYKYELALLLAVEAGRASKIRTVEAFDVLRQIFVRPGRTQLILNHNRQVLQANWNRDESLIMTSSEDDTVRVWDARTGQLHFSLGHDRRVTQAIWNKDESLILTGSNDDTARVWDASTGEERFRLTHDDMVGQAIWNKDESLILTSSEDGTVRVWDAVSGQEQLRLIHDDQVLEAIWNREESLILSHSWDGTARVWDAVSGQERLRLPHNDDGVGQAIWNQDESLILTTSGDTALVWDVSTGQARFSLGHDSSVTQATWNQDGSLILTKDYYDTVRVWEVSTGQESFSLSHGGGVINQAIWNQDGSLIMTSGNDGTARVWDASSGEERFRFTHDHSVEYAIWNQDETLILTSSTRFGGEGTVTVWDAGTGRELFRLTHDDMVGQAIWNKDETRILTSSNDGTARVWDIAGGYERVGLRHKLGVKEAVWSRDESQILTNGWDGTSRVWDAGTGQEYFRLSHGDFVEQAIWNQDESLILTSSWDGTARVWDAGTGQELFRLTHDDRVGRAIWNRDENRILTRSNDGTARVWNASTGQEYFRLNHDAPVEQAVWNEDESLILTTSISFAGDTKKGKTVWVWDASDGRERFRLTHTDSVMQALWNRDGNLILTRSWSDKVARVWDANTGQERFQLTHDDIVTQAIWNQDGSLILTSSQDGIVWVWDANTGQKRFSLSHGGGVINQAMWNQDESLILTVNKNSVWVWNASDGQEIFRLTHDDPNPIEYAIWNQDESLILTNSINGNTRGKTIWVWDAKNGQGRFRLTHAAPVTQAIWNQDGNLILTSSWDDTVRVWDASSGQEIFRFTHTAPVNQAIWNQDGSLILTSSGDTTRVFYSRMAELLTAACEHALRNLTHSEWDRFMPRIKPYRPTCESAPIPPDAIEAIINEVEQTANNGDIPSASQRLEELLGWLGQNGQYNFYGEDLVPKLVALQAGENPFRPDDIPAVDNQDTAAQDQ